MSTLMYDKIQKMTVALLMVLVLIVCQCVPTLASSVDAVQVRSAPLSENSITRNGMVRVYLSSLGSASVLDLTINGKYSISQNGAFVTNGSHLRVGFDSSSGNLTLVWNGQSFHMGKSFSLRRHSAEGSSGILIAQSRDSQNPYPGDLSFEAVYSDGGYNLYTIAHIYIEDYLYGVLPYEMGNSSGLEALKAQAVAARTYTVRMMEKRASGRYDVKDTTSDQVYRGTPSGNANCVAAVDATRGIVLMHNGEYITTYYSASNGGQTETSRSGSSYAYMKVKDDPFDYANPASTVRKKTIYADLTSAANPADLISILKTKAVWSLQRLGYPASETNIKLQSLKNVIPHTPMYASPSRLYTKMDFTFTVVAPNASGQTALVTLTETCDIFAELEGLLGMGIQSLKNELWSVEKTANGFVLQARRYGHGMGMSQRGAMYMAKLGYSYDQILGFYFENCNRVRHSFTKRILSASSSDQQITVDTPADLESKDDAVCTGTVTLTGSGAALAIRSSTASDADVIGTAANGALVEVLAQSDAWYQICFGEIVGFVPSSALLVTGTPEQQQQQTTAILGFATVTAKDFVNLRASGSMSAKVLGTAPTGAVLTIFQKNGAWAKVQYQGLAAYVNINYISSVSANYPSGELFSGTRKARVVTENGTGTVNLRESASMNAALVDRLPVNAEVTVLEDDGSWCRVSTTSGEGYILSDFLEYVTDVSEPADEPTVSPEEDDEADTPAEDSAEAEPAYAFVNTLSGSLNLRAEGRAGSQVLITIPKGAEVALLGRGDTWSAVRYGSYDGFVMTMYLSFAAPVPPVQDGTTTDNAGMTATVVTPGGTLNLRALPHAGSRIMARIPAHTVLLVMERGAEWCMVDFSGIQGYVMSQFLSFGTVSTPIEKPGDNQPEAMPEAGTEEEKTESKQYAYVNTQSGSLNLRSDPDGNSLIVDTIPQYARVVLIEKGDAWCRVVYDGNSGYVMSDYLSAEKPEKPDTDMPSGEQEKKARYITIDGVVLDVSLEVPSAATYAETAHETAVYDMCSETGNPLLILPAGEEVAILLIGENWCRIAWGNEQGYCWKDHLNVRSMP